MNIEYKRTLLVASFAALHDAIRQVQRSIPGATPGFWVPGLIQMSGNFRVVGRVSTVRAEPGGDGTRRDVLHSIEMLSRASADTVGVIAMPPGVACFGGIMAAMASFRQMAGVICLDAVRDLAEIREQCLPLWSKCVSPVSSVGLAKTVALDEPLEIEGCGVVHPGDWAVCDAEGVLFIGSAFIQSVIEAAAEIEARDAKTLDRVLKTGQLDHGAVV